MIMSGKGNCYDNAVTECFFATVEKEYLKQISLKTIKETKTKIFYYIEGRYNFFRKHSFLGNKSPDQFKKLYNGV